MLAKIFSRAQAGVDAPAVIVEVHQSNGLPALNIVGLPEAAVRESKDRVLSALINSRFDFPARKLTEFLWTIILSTGRTGTSVAD